MKLRNTLLCGVAATALGLAAALPTNSSILPSLTTPAHAQVQASVSIGFGTFYDSLSPHGDWVRLDGRNVWVPGDVRADWRPYTVGRWAYTRPYGWTWVSDEPYGWAVYHYGRWGYQPAMGWYWVPDTQWAPAWVTWRGSGEYTAWAPMPPQGAVQISYDVDPYAIPGRYWVAVPTAQFLAPSIFSVAISIGEPEFYDVVRYTRPIGHVRVVGDVVVNNTINVNYIERQTGENVRIREVNYINEPQQGDLRDDAVSLYAPTIEEEPDAEPRQVRAAEEIAEERGVEMAAEPADKQADQPIEVAEDAPPLPDEAMAEDAGPVTEEDVAEEADDQPQAAEGEQPEGQPKAAEGKKPKDQPAAAEGKKPKDQPQAAEGKKPKDQPAAAEGKKPKDQPEAAEGEKPKDQPAAAEGKKPKDQPAAAEGKKAKDQPAAAEGKKPKDQPKAAERKKPDAGAQVEERAIGEPAEQGQGQQGNAQEQPKKQRGQGKDKDDEEDLAQ